MNEENIDDTLRLAVGYMLVIQLYENSRCSSSRGLSNLVATLVYSIFIFLPQDLSGIVGTRTQAANACAPLVRNLAQRAPI